MEYPTFYFPSLRGLRIQKEQAAQMQVVSECAYLSQYFPTQYADLALIYAVPNHGKRSTATGKIETNCGLRAGVPDLCLPVPRRGFGAFYIEMKIKPNKKTENQETWIAALQEAGNLVVVAWNADDAIKILKDYIDGRLER